MLADSPRQAAAIAYLRPQHAHYVSQHQEDSHECVAERWQAQWWRSGYAASLTRLGHSACQKKEGHRYQG